MTQLLENTYNAYNQFLEGELNQYDLMSLIENEIISEELLESMLIESGLIDEEYYDEELEEGVMEFGKRLVNHLNPINDFKIIRAGKNILHKGKILHHNTMVNKNLSDVDSLSKDDYNNRMMMRNQLASALKSGRRIRDIIKKGFYRHENEPLKAIRVPTLDKDTSRGNCVGSVALKKIHDVVGKNSAELRSKLRN